MTTDVRTCDCVARPDMIRLGYAAADRYYLCPSCRTIRVEFALFNAPGTVGETAFLPHDDQALPAAVRDQAAELLARPRAAQGRLL